MTEVPIAAPAGPHRRSPRTAGLAVVVLLGVLTAVLGCAPAADDDPGAAPSESGAGTARTLVLYDTTGAYARLGELYATQVANLASRFGTWRAHPVSQFKAGGDRGYDAIVYLGSTYDEPLPGAFLDAVAADRTPVLWFNNNIWQLTARHPQLAGKYGFTLGPFDRAAVAEVRYGGASLTRNPAAGNLMRIAIKDPAKAKAVADAVRPDGSVTPWGVRAGKLTYVGELPLTFTSGNDRYLAAADLLYELLAPDTAVRHRALVRIDDVGPMSNPAQLRAIADYLHGRGVPFSVAVFAKYDDLAGKNSRGKPVHRTLDKSPAVVAALKHMVDRGGTLLMHGYTHAYPGGPNPYGVSGEDYEFYRARLDKAKRVVLTGPLKEDSTGWARGRLAAARQQWAAAKLPVPRIFEFPNDVASATAYRAVSTDPGVDARYERSVYYPGLLSDSTIDNSRPATQFFPYPVRDVYGTAVLPETLGNVAAQGSTGPGAQRPADLLAAAKRQLVVRDGVASFGYHAFLGLEHLPALVEGIQGLGYTFVAPQALIPR
ncbi:MAG TPA: DUF2334 domain-containing protein [Pilimelia sp.]|nr:DUF2334 domain-containing protein [Pilimelia sp.]